MGAVHSFTSPYWDIKYSDGDSEQMNFTELSGQLLPPGQEYGDLGRRYWSNLKLQYGAIREHLASRSSNFTDPNFLARIFHFRATGNITTTELKRKVKVACRKAHDDKVRHQPEQVQYVCGRVLACLRYCAELYAHKTNGAVAPAIDPPTLDEYPAYGSVEFALKVAVAQDSLTQEPPLVPPGGVGRHDTERVDDDGADDSGSPEDSSAFDNPGFDIESIEDNPSAIDPFSLDDTFQCPFTTVLRIPPSVAEDWARVYSRASKDLADAIELSDDDPTKDIQLARAAKWYSVLPQMILREPGRMGHKDIHILQLRLHQFLNGNLRHSSNTGSSNTGIEMS